MKKINSRPEKKINQKTASLVITLIHLIVGEQPIGKEFNILTLIGNSRPIGNMKPS